MEPALWGIAVFVVAFPCFIPVFIADVIHVHERDEEWAERDRAADERKRRLLGEP